MPLHKGNYLVCGMPRSGKGQLMRGLAERYRRAGLPVLYWSSKEAEIIGVRSLVDHCDSDPMAFYEYAEKMIKGFWKGTDEKRVWVDGRPCIVMIDEAADFQQQCPNELRIILNQWPAYGVETYVQVQRAKMVPPNVRNACDNCISFKQRPDDAQILADSYGDIFLQVASEEMPQGAFIAREGCYAKPVIGRSWEQPGGVETFKRV